MVSWISYSAFFESKPALADVPKVTARVPAIINASMAG